MATSVYINTDLKDLTANAVANINRPTQVVRLPQMVEGEVVDVVLHLVKSNGAYDARSGTAVDVAVAISAKGKAATSGTFKLNAGTQSTGNLSWNASAEAVAGALNALNGGSGAYGSKVSVSMLANGSYRVIFNDVGARVDIAGQSLDLAPESEVTAATSVVGSPTIRAQQVIEISQQPAIFSETWAVAGSTWTGQLNANTARVQELIAEGADAFFEIKVGTDVVCQVPISILPSVAAPNSFPAHTLPSNLCDFAEDPSTNGCFNPANWREDLSLVVGEDVQAHSSILDATDASFTTTQASDITTNNAKVGITPTQASDITTNNAKVGITPTQASDITTNNAKVGITPAQASDITANNAKVGITPAQASDITANTAKVGITSAQASDITANTAKVGITSAQASDITTNNAKVGITSAQASDITTNNAKVGITSAQASDITANNAKSVRTDANGAFSAGDLGGDGRGSNAINIQASRDNVAKVASGPNSVAIGNRTTASGYYGYGTAIGYGATASGYYGYATAIGRTATASGSYSTAVGYAAEASGLTSTAIGNDAEASGSFSIAIGRTATASGSNVAAIGFRAKTTVNNTAEIGYWSGSTTRAGAIRVHGTGMVAQTIQNRATAYGDGGATKGSEADNTVIRNGIAFRRNGNEILIDLNIGGTVTTLSLGTAS
jgi:hypothetical protein